MARKKEGLFQDKCIEFLQGLKIYYTNITPSGWGMKGEPDLICCVKGRYVAFELKVDDNQMDSAQRIKRDRIIKSGGRHYCPRSLPEFKRIIEELMGET